MKFLKNKQKALNFNILENTNYWIHTASISDSSFDSSNSSSNKSMSFFSFSLNFHCSRLTWGWFYFSNFITKSIQIAAINE